MRILSKIGLLVVLFLGLLPTLADAQNGFFRAVDAQTGQGIPVATLANAQGTTLAQSTQDGLLPNTTDAAYVLAAGYKTIHLEGAIPSVLKLQPLSALLPEAIAEGLRPQTFAKEEVEMTGARGVPALGKGQAANLGQDLPYLVQQTPSAITTSDAGTGVGYTSLRIRGSDATRTNVTLDGVPVNDAESQSTFWVDLPDLASTVQKVTVVRGVGSSSSGPGAFGAGLLLQTRQPSDTAFVTADNSVGSYGTRRHSFQLGTGKFGNGFSAEARFSRIASSGYIDRATSDLYSYLAVVRYQNKNGFSARLLHTSGSERTYQAWYGIDPARADTARTFNYAGTDYAEKNPAYPNQIDNYRQDYWQLHASQKLKGGWQAGGALFYTFGEGYYEEYKVQDALSNYGLRFRDTVPAPTDLVRRRWLRNHYFGATATLQYDTGRHNLVLGGLVSRYLGESFGRLIWGESTFLPGPDYEYYLTNSVKQEASGFAKYTYALPIGLSLYGDVQVRGLTYAISGLESGNLPVNLSKKFLFFNPKAGIGYDGGKAGRIFLSVAVAHREPTRTTYTDSRGGTDPKAERLTDFELTYQTQIGSLREEVTLFYMDYAHQLVQTGQLSDVGSAIFRNVDRSYRRGIEYALTFKPSPKWILSGSATLSSNRIKSFSDTALNDQSQKLPAVYTNTQIALSPSFSSQGRLTWLPIPTLDATVLGRYIGKQYLDNRGQDAYSIPAYALADLRLAYRLPIKTWVRVAQITAQVNNVANVKYTNNGYVYQNQSNVYPQAGRTYWMGLVLSW